MHLLNELITTNWRYVPKIETSLYKAGHSRGTDAVVPENLSQFSRHTNKFIRA